MTNNTQRTSKRSKPLVTLINSDIRTTRIAGRRSFLRALGVTFAGAAAVVIGQAPASARDFPKGVSDSDVTINSDLKHVDSDQHNSKAVDVDRSTLRDARRSGDSD